MTRSLFDFDGGRFLGDQNSARVPGVSRFSASCLFEELSHGYGQHLVRSLPLFREKRLVLFLVLVNQLLHRLSVFFIAEH